MGLRRQKEPLQSVFSHEGGRDFPGFTSVLADGLEPIRWAHHRLTEGIIERVPLASRREVALQSLNEPSPPGPESPERGRGIGKLKPPDFDLVSFLSCAGRSRTIIQLKPKQFFFSEGSPADSVFYIQTGRAKLTVVAKSGKEATVMLFGPGDFVGEDSLAAERGVRVAAASAITRCTALKIERREMIRVMHEETALSELFLNFLLIRNIRAQADLVDQLFNGTEKRLARALLLMAEFGKPGDPEPWIPPITQETLAEMIGTSRSRVNFFMNRFRKLGFIEYKRRIRVHKSLLNVVLHD